MQSMMVGLSPEIRSDLAKECPMNESALISPSKLAMSWLQVRMAWQSVKNTRLDQEKTDVITALVRHYRWLREPDRPRPEFEQVLLKLEEEHNLRVRELGTEGRRVAKQVNNVIQVIRDTNEARMQQCRDRVEETLIMLAEWKSLMDLLFEDTGC